MKITKLTFKNFMGYRNLNLPEGNDEEFPEGLILISGKNSYGKSSILQGILMAFFGPKIYTGRSGASFITYGQNKAEIYIYFTMDNINYYILRKWGRTGGATSKLFEFDKKSRRFLEIKKFNIEKFLEISKDQAMSTVFVRQGEVEELANIKGAKLRDMIIDLFRLDIIDDSLKYLDEKAKSLNREKAKLESSRVPIERIENDIQDLELQIKEFSVNISEQEGLKTKNESKLNSYPSESLISNLEELYKQNGISENKLMSYKSDFENKIKKTKMNVKNFTSIDKIITLINDLIKERKEMDAKRQEYDRKRQATNKGIGKTKGRIEEINNKISKMNDSLKFTQKAGGQSKAKCPTCQSDLTKEHYDEVIQEFNNVLKINKGKLQDISKLIKNYESKLKKLQTSFDKINIEIADLQGLRHDFENFKKYENETKRLQGEIDTFLKEHVDKFVDISPEGIKALSKEIIECKGNLDAIKKDIESKNNYIKNNEKKISELLEEIKNMKKLADQVGEIEVDLEHINKAKELVRRFVTEYMVAKRLVKNIALKADKYVKNFTAGQYGELLLKESGSKKTGLLLNIKDNYNGQYEPIEVLSGGDRTALGMALRLAISELMSIIRPTKDSPKKNPNIDFLLLDEPLAALDEIRRERILLYLTKSKSFSQIFLITHTAIPPDINVHKILVNKDHSTGISNATFDKFTPSFSKS